MGNDILLVEYRDRFVDLAREDALFIESALLNQIEIHRSVAGSQYILNPKQYVGVVQLPSGRRLESRPKVPVSNLLYMLAIASDLPSPLLNEWAGFDRFDEILEFIVEHFVDVVDARIAAGLYRAYIDREENLPAVRGKIVVEQNLRRNAINRHLTYCRYGDLTWDIPENQIIRQTVHFLSLWGFNHKLRLRLWQLDSQLQEITPTVLPLRIFESFKYHRFNAEYEPIHNLCWLFLSGASLSELAGDVPFPTFLIDMNKLFEAFVTQILKKHLSPGIMVSAQSRRNLDERGKIRMRLDLAFKIRGRLIGVGDCKYKVQSAEDAKVTDVYQVLAYATASNVSRSFLIYPAHEKSVDDELRILNTGVTVRRMAIDLGVESHLLHHEALRFADGIRSHLSPHDLPSAASAFSEPPTLSHQRV
jgi:5-methylcytosine-specific restriction enzyme subunit McrC